MSKELMSRVSVPSKIIELLWTDDEFFREVSSNKKVSGQNKFPRCDQWCDEGGFHMAFALTGYSPENLSINVIENHITISGVGPKTSVEPEVESEVIEVSDDLEEYPPPTPQLMVQRGVIVRGIARRSFRISYFINPAFNVEKATAFMKNGLLEVVMPRSNTLGSKNIEIMER